MSAHDIDSSFMSLSSAIAMATYREREAAVIVLIDRSSFTPGHLSEAYATPPIVSSINVSKRETQLEEKIRPLHSEIHAIEQSNTKSSSESNNRESTITHPVSAQLNKFVARQTDHTLPTFSAAPEEWPVFYQLILTSREACAVSDAENLRRLKKSMKGKARELLQSLLAIPQNVPSIIRTLQMRYGRPDIIVLSLIKKVQSLPSVDDKNLIDFAVAV